MMRIESLLEQAINALPKSEVRDAMQYSLMAGGKRIRPQLLFDVAKGYDICSKDVDAFAVAIEMIHTYSLIHDDLPAMDNDDLRRGKPTCHKQFDEATAILAGDGLLTYAFAVPTKNPLDLNGVCKSIAILADMAGAGGMVLGQNLDMNEELNQSTWEDIINVHHYKTGCLLSAPMMIGATLAGQSDEVVKRWLQVGVTLGLAFQIQDDVLDVQLTPEEFGKSNSDERNEKVTSVTLLGLDSAEALFKKYYEEAEEMIRSFSDFNPDALLCTVSALKTRRK